ncbi:MAG TPA: 1-deoxy-D-xylulose-5-phosphate synthase [Bacteroidota bacterium]|jgi:1-deoxy-D-xylulose-5-phosphate synthase|nr:1-deoxy-D-xylulose-5-phosphate synthase [Bacteroidota bacterium]
MTDSPYKYLLDINSPSDLRKLSVPELKTVCAELRTFLIDTISKVGGHLGAGLGAVELAVALHYVFNTPDDKLVWDVGHQAYPHKILTERRDVFHTIRQLGGISGFLRRSESVYDTFGAGHASTAISAALGMAVARDLAKETFRVVAVVGDGAMTGGMAYEAMNNAGLQKRNMIVVLNDNNMSIAPNVWALSNYFTELIATPAYNKFKANVWDLTGKLDTIGDRIRKIASRVQEGIKVVITPGILFEALGFRYFGPINGHNVTQLVKIFSEIKGLNGPILVHTITRKGKGYKPAEADEQALHGVTPFDKITGVSPKKADGAPAYTKVFGKAVVEIAKENPKVVGITAAMPDGTGLDQLQQQFPERFFDVGIAEQHAVTFAAGLATQGYIPITAIYSTFLQRAYDQIIHDVAIQRLHVVFCLDRAGLVGADGPTHHGVLDLSYLRCIQGMVVMAPKDESELRDMVYTAVQYTGGPVAVRYPRGTGIGVPMKTGFDLIEIGTGEIVRPGKDVAILAIGTMVSPSLKAADLLQNDGISAEVVNMRFVKPIDHSLIEKICSRFKYILTVEDHVVEGGFGSAVLEAIASRPHPQLQVKVHGVPGEFIEHGTPQELYAMLKLDAPGIASVVKNFFRQAPLPAPAVTLA